MNRDDLPPLVGSLDDDLACGEFPLVAMFRLALACEMLGLCGRHLCTLAGDLARALDARDCAGNFRHAERIARDDDLCWPSLLDGLHRLGARCDCEALRVVLGLAPR